MTEYKYDISFITINYNGIDETCDLINSLRTVIKSCTYEIIVVDNASRKDEASVLQSRYPFIKVIRSVRNLGFAGGNNLALDVAEGAYLMFINNDTFIEKDEMLPLLHRIKSSPTVGVVCPKLRFAWSPRPIQFAGFTPLSAITLRNKGIGYGENDEGQYDEACETAFAHGAAMLVRREVIDTVGPMWNGFFLYYEEMDWSTRIIEAGYSIWYEPACTVFHKESKSVGMGSPLKTYYLTRNRLLYAKRNRRGLKKLLCYLYLTSVSLFVHIPLYIIKGRAQHALKVFQGLNHFYFKQCFGPFST